MALLNETHTHTHQVVETTKRQDETLCWDLVAGACVHACVQDEVHTRAQTVEERLFLATTTTQTQQCRLPPSHTCNKFGQPHAGGASAL